MPEPIRPADHEAKARAAEYLDHDTPNGGTPLWEAIVALDTLAVLAGIPNPAATVTVPREARSILLDASHQGPEALAAACLRRAAAWATALADALPQACAHCGAAVRPVDDDWIHAHGLYRCQSSTVAYGHLAHPPGVPCRADGPNPCLGATA